MLKCVHGHGPAIARQNEGQDHQIHSDVKTVEEEGARVGHDVLERHGPEVAHVERLFFGVLGFGVCLLIVFRVFGILRFGGFGTSVFDFFGLFIVLSFVRCSVLNMCGVCAS